MTGESEITELLRRAKAVVVITGSGVSAESGIPTFRGEDGLWRRYRAEELATPRAFFANPGLVWEWYDWRRGIIAEAKPNPAHETIAAMEAHYPEFLLITQNVDGLHRRAGSEKMVEIHGNIWRVCCVSCGRESFDYDVPLEALPPKCECGELLRPGVVWFGESLPLEPLNRAMDSLHHCDLVMTVGTSGVVHPVAAFPGMAKSRGAVLVEFNTEQTPISQIADYTIMGRAGDTLPSVWSKV